MNTAYLSFAYLLSSVLFILSIRGLASPDTARRGNILGMVAMLIAIIVTMFSPLVSEYLWIAAAVVFGGLVGTFIALRVKMTSLPR